MNIRERLLGNTFVYKTFKSLVSPPAMERKTVHEFLDVPDTSKVLDLGCGYGDIARFYVNRCNYLGVDSNVGYINEARRRNSDTNAEFIVADITDTYLHEKGPFDLVLLSGVLHHLTSEQVSSIATAARDLVSPTGRLVAIEPVFAPDQRLSARLIIASDRGRYVRDAEGYQNILKAGFEDVQAEIVHGRLRIPYSHVILTCRH
jgi:cyclopropane fatty-acyl-phospholipid synthase-like methyltransferase